MEIKTVQAKELQFLNDAYEDRMYNMSLSIGIRTHPLTFELQAPKLTATARYVERRKARTVARLTT